MGRLTHRTTPGFTYFVTTNSWQNRVVFGVPETAKILLECLVRYRNEGHYVLHEFVVMPNHLHLMLTPTSNTTLEKAMMLIKGGSSHEIHLRREHKMQIWQPGFHEESIRDQQDYRRKSEYIRMNPVEAHLVDKPERWAYSSASRDLQSKVDPMPARLKSSISGAKAPSCAGHNVGAKAPTP